MTKTIHINYRLGTSLISMVVALSVPIHHTRSGNKKEEEIIAEPIAEINTHVGIKRI